MKLVPFFLLLLLLVASCHKTEVAAPSLQAGDLLFVAATSSEGLNDAIVTATSRGDSLSFTHVAIIEQQKQQTYIIEADPDLGVVCRPLQEFLHYYTLADGTQPTMVVMRLTDSSHIHHYLQQDHALCGRDYDKAFLPNNNEFYCSELVRHAYVTPLGDTLFGQQPMNFLAPNSTLPPYWQQWFAALNIAVPQGVMGTNPQHLSHSLLLYTVGTLHDIAY